MINFYEVDVDYINYLKEAETKARGKTFVPDIVYSGGHNKFLCGIIWEEPVHHIPYFVALSSYKIQRSENILIVVPEDQQPVKASLRFNYMIPVPLQAVAYKDFRKEPNPAYRRLLQKELHFVRQNEAEIFAKAQEVHDTVVNKTGSLRMLDNSCDFLLLEQAYLTYCSRNEFIQPENEAQSLSFNK